MNANWIKANKANNGYVVTWPEVVDDAGHTALEHEVLAHEPGQNGKALGLKKLLERIAEHFRPSLDLRDLYVYVVVKDADGREVDLD